MNTSGIPWGNTRRRPGKFRGGFWGALPHCAAWLLLCLLRLPLPALAGENIIWNGPGAQGNTGRLRPDPMGLITDASLFPDGPSNNSVTVNGDVPGNVFGGLDYRSGNGAAEVSGNSVSVSGGTIGSGVGGGYAESSGTATATARGNSVSVSGGTINLNVVGGDASSASGTATAGGNRVTVSGGKISGDVYGGGATSMGTGTATARGNSVSVSGGTINGSVYGGGASSEFGTATATGNSVSVSGGTINGSVYGGHAGHYSGTISATGNTVTLSGSPVFGAATGLYGGYATDFFTGTTASGADVFTGNTLNVWNYTGSAVNSVQNFQYYNFALPASLQALTAGALTLGDGSTDSAITGVNIMGGGSVPKAGDVLPLISASTITGAISNDGATISGKKGVSLLYDFQLTQTAAALTATVVGGPRLNPQTKAFSEGRVAGLAFVNQGADLAAGTGMRAARGAGTGFSAFAVGQGGTSRYDTGSHVDVDGFSLMAGLAWNARTGYGKLLLGAFFEAGWGNYDSRNSFSGFASVKGDGDTKYYGGGILSRFDFKNTGPGAIYAEASLRAGWSETDFSSSDLRDGIGQKAEYDSGSAYYGAHVGLGYLWNIGQASSLDLYTKYFWTHQNSDSVSVVGDPVKFKSADSHRWRGGARFSHTLATESGLAFTPYIGAAYEHEFDGKAKAAAYGYSIDAPDLTGGAGMGELGFSLKPSADGGLSFDLAVQGYAGVREGVTGSFQLRWEF